MSPDIRPPTQAEIEQAIKSHSIGNTRNSEIGNALEQFEKEQGGMATPQMSETVDVLRGQRIEIPEDINTSKMAQRVIKWSGGAIKDQRQAEWVLLGFVVVAMAISFYLFFGGRYQSSRLSSEQLRQIQEMERSLMQR